jgi:predicted RNase H-like nuclease (RuvC/YqgF family)
MPDHCAEFVTEFNLRCKVAQLNSEVQRNNSRLDDHHVCFERCSEEMYKFLDMFEELKEQLEELSSENRRLKKQLYCFAHLTSNRVTNLERKVDNHEKLLNDLTVKMEKLSLV